MDTIEEMLETWQRSSSVMHIAHHVAAARYAKNQRLFGALVSGLSALVATSLFASAVQGDGGTPTFLAAVVLSLLAAIMTAVNTTLNLSSKAESHHNAAVRFQGLRREIEEDLVRCRNGEAQKSYEHIRNRWTEALEQAPPLPPRIHEKVKKNIDTIYAE